MKVLRWILLVAVFALTGLVLGSPPSGAAPTCTRTLIANGSFTNPANWAPAGVPTAADYVCIPFGRTASLTTTHTVDGMRVEGELAGSVTGTLVINDGGVASPSELDGVLSSNLRVDVGQLVATSAEMRGARTTRVAPGASMKVRNPDYYGLLVGGSHTVQNEGVLRLEEAAGSSWPAVQLNETGTSITGGGLLEMVAGADVAGPGVLRVGIGGVARTVTAGGSSVVDAPVELAGRIDPAAGSSLRLARVAPPTAGGTSGVLTTSGGSLLVNDVTVPAGSRISSVGTGVTLDGTLDGAGELLVSSGTLTAESVYAPGSATARVAPGATLVVRNTAYYGLLLGGTSRLVNDGTVQLTESAGSFWPSVLLNEAGTSVVNNTTLELRAGADVAGPGSLVNAPTGTVSKPTGAETSSIDSVVENDGTVTSAVGLLDINSDTTGGTSTGSFTSAPEASLELGGVTLGSGATLAGPTSAGSGRVVLDGSRVVVPDGSTVPATGRTGLYGTVDGAGTLEVASGTMIASSAYLPGSGTTRVASGATLLVRNPDYYGFLAGATHTLVNEGLVRLEESPGSFWTSLLLNEHGTSMVNRAALELVDGADIAGPGVLKVPDQGVVSSVTAGTTSSVDAPIELAGRIDPAAGALEVSDVAPPPAGATTGLLTGSGGTLRVNRMTVPSGSAISATGSGVTLDGTVAGSGQLLVPSGSVTAESLHVPDSLTARVAPQGTLVVLNPDYYGLLLGGTSRLVNDGSVRLDEVTGSSWQSVLLNEAGTSLVNNAALELRRGADVAGPGSLSNAATGTMTKSTGTTTSDISVATDNRGTARSENGLLDFTGTFSSMTGTTLTRGTYEMLSPGKIKLPADVVRNDATILLDGTAAAMQDTASATNALANLNRVGPTGSLTVRGGKAQATGALTQQGSVTVGAGSRLGAPSFNQTEGLTSVLREGHLSATNLATVAGGVLRGTGTVAAGGGLRVTTTGVLEPGLAGPGTLAVTGNLTLADPGSLALDVDGTSAGAHDLLAVSGTADTGGVLDLDTGFAPTVGDTVTVLTSGGTRSGTFADARGGDLPGDVSWAADYTASSVALRGATPSLDVADASATEGNAGTSSLGFAVTASEQVLAPQRVTATPADGTATAGGPAVGGGDYEAAPTTVTIPVGATSRQVDVTVKGDAVYEHDDDLTIALGSAENATIADGSATGTIENDEAVPTLTLTGANAIERDPGDAAATVPVRATLSGLSAFTTSARLATSNGTAGSGDYTARAATVSLAPGQTTKTFAVTVTGDLETEADETFRVTPSVPRPIGDVVLGSARNGTIRDDDAAVSVEPTTVDEPLPIIGRTATATVRVSLSHPNPRPVSVSVTTADGSATAAGDYAALAPTTVSFPAGQSARTVEVTVRGDTVVEGDEGFGVALSEVTGGQPGTTSAEVTIKADRCTVMDTGAGQPLLGTAGDDVICGLDGDDTLLPGAGNDEVYGGHYTDDPGAANGTDTLSYAGLGCGVEVDLRNRYAEDPAATTCIGASRDLILGVEDLIGGNGPDALRGNEGANTIRGGPGNDTLLGDSGDDTLDGGDGTDAASYVRGVIGTGGVLVNLAVEGAQATGAGTDTLTRIEDLFGSTGDDVLRGDVEKNTLSGLEGNDTIFGGAADDIIYGLAGNDVLNGDAGIDRIFGDIGRDIIHGGDDIDVNLDGGAGANDRVWGDGGTETASHVTGGTGLGDYCGQGATAAEGALAGVGCEN